MRLSKIKLAGFKSFVDPTTIHFLSNLTAVAGPNGCGKSNVIDAVRWVMGESSAKHLRGGALTDVIFSGSSARKPVGQATVELLFDNSEGKLGGQYATYTEIAIKRQVTRDGQSNYFLNGQRCRRRDITDIFLGTGLGPRSYAIIEQGMISRVIEAKPEDLRTFLEEAAGISKYKERRRETENRIQHTQDNLARLNDLQGELETQLKHLHRQSQAAMRYQELKVQEREMSAQLAALAWRRLDIEIQEHEGKIRDTSVKLEAEQANFQHLKTEQEKQRIVQTESNEALNEVQRRFYSVGADIAKTEQTISHHIDRLAQLKADKEEAEQTLEAAQSQLCQDQDTILNLSELVAELEPQHEDAVSEAQEAIEIQHNAEAALEQWQDNTTQLQQMSLAPTRQAESEKAKIAQLERQIHLTQERQIRLDEELKNQQPNEEFELGASQEKIEQTQLVIDNIIERIQTCLEQKEQLLQNLNALRPQIKEKQKSLNGMQGQQVALQALQTAALGKDENARTVWLQQQGLSKQQHLVEKIEVTSGWEIAVEAVLGAFLEAVGIESGQLLSITQGLNLLNEVGINLIEWQANKQMPRNTNSQRLVHFIRGTDHLPDSIYHLLESVHVCETLEQATAILANLNASESVITPSGCWLGQGWAKVKGNQKEENQTSILIREENLKKLSQQIALEQEVLASLQTRFDECEENLKQVELERDSLQHEKNKIQQELITHKSELRIRQNRNEQNQKRFDQIQQELIECHELIHSSQVEVNVSRINLQESLELMSKFNQENEILAKRRGLIQDEVASSRIKVKEKSAYVQQIALKLQTFRTQINSLNENVERFKKQIESVQFRIANILLSLEKNEEPIAILKEELEINLEKRISIEIELNKARDFVAEVDNHLREIEQQINQHDQKIQTCREILEQTKMGWQALSVRRESATEKLKNTDFTIEDLIAKMPAEANEKEWQELLIDIEHKIQRLGAINLAAIEEYQAAQQRKEYMDSQVNDLVEALTTLENAIKKIDRETRAKFKETFDKVNDGFTQLFPQLFGGGQAQLMMTGEDLLDTGISLIARPPGKKNSSIQQLSGGEKALTAVALVFSMFQLNPAPFCMLDEVDAPLDDNNVGRFCDLVKQMSKTIQFIYVSHNKLAIEMAEQLQGVTMREPGVSRLVTVDIEEAKSMAQA